MSTAVEPAVALPTPPFWFRQRQGKLEAAGPDLLRLTAPNLAEAFIGIREAAGGRWAPFLRFTTAGPDAATSPISYDHRADAWGAAFELYRVNVVI